MATQTQPATKPAFMTPTRVAWIYSVLALAIMAAIAAVVIWAYAS